MIQKVKYIRTSNSQIIIFPEYLQHDEFINFKPVTAGFISIRTNRFGDLLCDCYGESISLDLKSNPEKDSMLAYQQILNNSY